MRVVVAFAAFASLLVGCTSTVKTDAPDSANPWHVVPLAMSGTVPDRPAILVNEQTGETWIYELSSNQWWPVQRK
jgi:hypothetical protein